MPRVEPFPVAVSHQTTSATMNLMLTGPTRGTLPLPKKGSPSLPGTLAAAKGRVL
jgi:hypothetical protein